MCLFVIFSAMFGMPQPRTWNISSKISTGISYWTGLQNPSLRNISWSLSL